MKIEAWAKGLIGLIVLVMGCAALILTYLRVQTKQEPGYQPIIFSDHGYPEYQKQLAVLLDPEDKELPPEDIAIALVDLNDDGVKEIIAFVFNSKWGGSGGNITVIYQQNGKRLTQLSDVGNTYGALAVLPHKTAGYHDIASYAEGFPIGTGQYNKHILAWDEQQTDYGYSQSIRITKEALESFLNETLR